MIVVLSYVMPEGCVAGVFALEGKHHSMMSTSGNVWNALSKYCTMILTECQTRECNNIVVNLENSSIWRSREECDSILPLSEARDPDRSFARTFGAMGMYF